MCRSYFTVEILNSISFQIKKFLPILFHPLQNREDPRSYVVTDYSFIKKPDVAQALLERTMKERDRILDSKTRHI
jgi:ABC-type nitrate/sulfonate/bicarbonate transport system substrate-binding protein